MPNEQHLLKVFLCHASLDKPKVRELYRYLRRCGIKPWFDEMDLVGGQDWQVEIPKALLTSDAIIICLTNNSVDKEGYIQKEIKFALDKALEMPEGRIFLIPVRFEECEVPFSLSRYQWVDLFDEAGYARMMRALKFRAAQLQRITVEVPKKDIEKEKLALEKAGREKEELEIAKKTEREKAEKITQEKLEHDASEKDRKEKAQREAAEKAQKAAQENLERKAAEKANREKVERDVAEKAAREKLHQEVTEITTREILEQEAEEPSRKIPQEKAGNQQREYKEKTLPKVQLTPKQEIELKKHKLPRRLNGINVIVLMGLAGVIVAGLLSSLLIEKWYSPAPVATELATDTSTLTSQTVIQSKTIEPSQIPTKSFTPRLASTVTLTPTLTPLPEGYVLVPDVVGQKYSGAESTLRKMGFKVQYAYVVRPGISAGEIVEQTPQKGIGLKIGETILLDRTIYATPLQIDNPLILYTQAGDVYYFIYEFVGGNSYKISASTFTQGFDEYFTTVLLDLDLHQIDAMKSETTLTYSPSQSNYAVISVSQCCYTWDPGLKVGIKVTQLP